MRMTGLLLLICAFVAGVFFGIWMDWSVVKVVLAGGRQLRYDVQDYQQANLDVHPGDTLSVAGPDGNPVTGLQMNFQGYSPCKTGSSADKCEIDTNADPGPYFFTCSGGGYSCPDPAIQQSSTTSPFRFGAYSYGKAVKVDFAHLFGAKLSTEEKPIADSRQAASVAAGPMVATVSCNASTNTTVLTGRDGSDLTNLKPATNQPVFWVSPKPFNLNVSSFPAGFCPSSLNPGGSNLKQAQCNDLIAGQNLTYSIQAVTTPACNALPATLTTPASNLKK